MAKKPEKGKEGAAKGEPAAKPVTPGDVQRSIQRIGNYEAAFQEFETRVYATLAEGRESVDAGLKDLGSRTLEMEKRVDRYVETAEAGDATRLESAKAELTGVYSAHKTEVTRLITESETRIGKLLEDHRTVVAKERAEYAADRDAELKKATEITGKYLEAAEKMEQFLKGIGG